HLAPTTVAKRAVDPDGELDQAPAAARYTHCGQGLAEKESRFPSADRERWQQVLDRRWRGWVMSPDSKIPGPEWWLIHSPHHAQERRSVPGPSRLGAARLDSLFRWLVSQGPREIDLCDRKNKHQPCRIPSAVRFPWL